MDTPVLTAIIAASVATIGVAVAKDSKVSEFRQEWIDAFRDDVSRLCAVTIALYWENVGAILYNPTQTASKSKADELILEANWLRSRIRLRLDPSKPETDVFLDGIAGLIGHSRGSTQLQVLEEQVDIVTDQASSILDEAWERVKKGETRFQVTFRIAFAALILALVIGATQWIWSHQFVSQSHFAQWITRL